MAFKPSRVRTGILPLDHCNAAGPWANQPWHIRQVFKRAQQKVLRWRPVIANYGMLADTWGTAMTGFVVGVGLPAYGTDGNPTGAFAATPTTIQTATTVAAGAPYVGPWVSASTFDPSADDFMLSYGFITAASGAASYYSGQRCWQTFVNTDALVANPAGLTYSFNACMLTGYIEYEFADDTAPSILVIGNSISSVASASVEHTGLGGSWHQIWARRFGGFAASLAVAGSFMAHYKSGNNRWNFYNGVNTPLDFDAVVYLAANSSDAVDNSLAVTQADTALVVARGKALWPKAKHIGSTIPARVGFTGDPTVNTTNEYRRLQLNEWMGLQAVGLFDSVVDIDDFSGDAAVAPNPRRLKPYFTTDGTHARPRMHEEMALRVPVSRRRVI